MGPLTISEASFQSQVVELARRYGWRLMLIKPTQIRSGRWVTATTGDTGFPDLILCKGKSLIFAELKRPNGQLSDSQKVWLDALIRAGQEVYLWYPLNLPDIKDRLAKG